MKAEAPARVSVPKSVKLFWRGRSWTSRHEYTLEVTNIKGIGSPVRRVRAGSGGLVIYRLNRGECLGTIII